MVCEYVEEIIQYIYIYEKMGYVRLSSGMGGRCVEL